MASDTHSTLPPARGQRLVGFSQTRIVNLLCLALLILSIGSCAFLTAFVPGVGSLLDGLTACKGAPAPWLDQLNLADQQAKKTDPNAVLQVVTLYMVSSPGVVEDPNSCLDLSFRYMRSNGHIIEVLIRDTDPPDVLRTNPNEGFTSAPTQEDLAQYQHARDKLKIGPREALRRTYADGLAFSKSQGANVNISGVDTYLDEGPFNPQGLPNWMIMYLTPSRLLIIRVSPEDGRILEKTER